MKINNICLYVFLWSLCLLSNSLFAQESNVSTKASATIYPYDTSADSVYMGDWMKLYLEAECPKDIQIEWPALTLDDKKNFAGLEVIELGKIDTTIEGDKVLLQQTITLIGFDEGDVTIPSFRFPYKTEGKTIGTIRTQPLPISIFAPKIDTTANADIKPITNLMEVPKSLKEYIPYVLMLCIGLIILLLAIYLIRKFIKPTDIVEAPKPIVPAHELALKRLDMLEKQKYWQQGKVKQYYSDLTEIVREYIENRYGVQALELTSEEILEAFNGLNVRKSVLRKLEETLNLSDFVKFAKAKPSIDEHNKHLNNANDFIRKTYKVKEVDTEGKKK